MKGQTNAKLASKGIQGESVNITLLTNQESHSDLIGAVITVSYGGVDTEYVWEGSEVTVKIPAMTEYSVSVSEVEGYATPEGFSATSQMGYSRKLEMTYQCELVTVNVSADNGILPDEFEVTITDSEGNMLITSNESTFSIKIPYNTVYTVSASDVSGYITPATQTFTAAKSVRDLGVVYNLDLKGVWIQDVNGKLWAVDDWDNSVAYNGVAIITDKHSFVLAPKYITGKQSNFGAFTYVAGVTTTTDIAIAQNDFNGYENTQIWIEAGSVSAKKAAQYIFPNGQNGYLPSAGEAQMVLDNLSEVKKAVAITAGSNINNIQFVTSTQYDSDEVWYFGATSQSDSTYQALKHYEKTVSMIVWPAAKLK